MRLAISNIAWDTSEDEQIARLLRLYGIDAIDVAPGKYFPEPAKALQKDITKVRDWWNEKGIQITGMQALLFGTIGLNIFGSVNSREAMLVHLEAVCRIGAGLGAKLLVFGSPKNRDRSDLSDSQAEEIAIPFFRQLGDIAHAHDVKICLEPNPVRYGANFMITTEETAAVVKQVAHPSIMMQLDTGALTINEESPSSLIPHCLSIIGHIHASEPDLVPLGDGDCDHGSVARELKRHLPEMLISIEMLATTDEFHASSIERALNNAIHFYRSSTDKPSG